jgi:hypothetical protein
MDISRTSFSPSLKYFLLMNYPEAELRGICALVYSNNLN